MSVVRIQNAQKYYNKGRSNELHVMNDISLELPESGMVAIFGQSGCGKTTLLNAVGGLDQIASGSIELFGKNIREDTDTLRNRYIGYIFQNYNLNELETVHDNVAAALRLCGMTDEREITERVTAALCNVGMDKYIARTPDTLSGGQQQRVAIARALVKNPAIILADEPTGNLDEANTVLVMDILKEISKTHLVLLVTHEAHLVDFYCDRIIEIVDGRVVGDRQNEGATGYVRRNKNDIYLGELQKQETAAPGVTLSYYGEPSDTPLGLTLVRVGGKLYLKCDDPAVKLLDAGSEIRLREGVFDQTPPTGDETGANRNGHTIDMSRLTPVEGKHYGRMYHFGNALKSAWQENFHKKPGRRRRGRGLRVILILVAVVLAFMSAVIGAGFKDFIETVASHNENLYYIPLDPAVNYQHLNASPGHDGILHSRIVGMDILHDGETITFDTAAFMTAEMATLQADGYAQSIDCMPNLTTVAGTTEIKEANEIVITTAMADDLIESSTVGYIDSYKDMIGMVTRNGYYSYGNWSVQYRVVGVVESSEAFYYVAPLTLSHYLLSENIGMDVRALSETELDLSLKDGELAYIWWRWADEDANEIAPYAVGDSISIMGKNFTVAQVLTQTIDESNQDDLYGFVIGDKDFESLAYTVEPDAGAFYHAFDAGDKVYYSNHIQIRTNDPAATEAYLTSVLGEDGYLTPDDVLSEAVADFRTAALWKGAVLLFFLALMCLCVFFIMRSSFMGRVREVGILRAIGVTRKNLVFRFTVETGLLLLLTSVIGYLCTWLFLASLSGAPLFSAVFYFPPWYALGLLVIILAVGLLFGVLPAILLLRKTPSEILAKYDI